MSGEQVHGFTQVSLHTRACREQSDDTRRNGNLREPARGEHLADEQLVIETPGDRARSHPASWIGVLGLIGPVRRRSPLVYDGTCPSCLERTLTLRITVGGEIPTCDGCDVLTIRRALVALRDRTPTLGADPVPATREALTPPTTPSTSASAPRVVAAADVDNTTTRRIP